MRGGPRNVDEQALPHYLLQSLLLILSGGGHVNHIPLTEAVIEELHGVTLFPASLSRSASASSQP